MCSDFIHISADFIVFVVVRMKECCKYFVLKMPVVLKLKYLSENSMHNYIKKTKLNIFIVLHFWDDCASLQASVCVCVCV